MSKKKSTKATYRLYEDALRLLYEKKYDKAHKALTRFQKQSADRLEIMPRVQSLLKVCERGLELPPKTAEEMYDRGVLCHNRGDYEQALEYFNSALNESGSEQDHVYFAMAATEAQRGNAELALDNLKRSIELNEINRFSARYDPDFEPVSRQDQFRQLIQPGSPAR
ncbi:MAG: tetratricopeptide repeat protein [Acidobacteriota bacterium]